MLNNSLFTLALVNAQTNQIVPDYEDLSRVDAIALEKLDFTQFSIIAQVNPNHPDAKLVKSIKFESPFGQQIENVKPYALFGDSNGNFKGNKFNLGNFPLKATAYSQGSGTGKILESTNLNYTIVESPVTKNQNNPITSSGSQPVYLAENGQLVIEAESATPVGNWENISVDGATGLLWDANKSSLNGVPQGETLSYEFQTDESGKYQLALYSGRIQSAIDTRDPDRSVTKWRNGDTGNNDVYVSIVDTETQKIVQKPTRLFTGLPYTSDGKLSWGNTFDFTNAKEPISKSSTRKRAELDLEANKKYRLEITGRSDGYVVDRITLRNSFHVNDKDQNRPPLPIPQTEQPNPNLQSAPTQADLDRYPAIAEWSKAGVEGGIPQDLTVVKTIKPGNDIQDSINQAKASGGGVILLEKGTYNISKAIQMEDNVVIRGRDREDVVIKSNIRAKSNFSGNATFVFAGDQYAGLENLTIDYTIPDFKPDPTFYKNNPQGRTDLYTPQISIRTNSSNNWVKGVNVLNSGSDPIKVEGNHNTLTNNYIDGSYNKGGGGQGYYRINGSYNLIKGETIKNLRHLGILNDRAEYNVITGSQIETDVNFHLGDPGNNLVEGNTLDITDFHGWGTLATGGPSFDHLPPGDKNIVVNNRTLFRGQSPFSQKDVIYTFEGYGTPVATNWKMPEGGKFYYGDIDIKPTVSQNSFLIEAESMQLGGEYKVENIGAASGGKVISLRGGAVEGTGTAKFNFNGASGNYNVKIHYFDENDGVGKINLKQGNQQVGSFNLSKQLGSPLANGNTLTSTEIKNVSIKAGETFTLEGFEDGTATTAEHGRIDKVEFIRTVEPIRINTGGGAFTDSSGNQWIADKYFQGGKTYSTTAGIDKTQDDKLFQSERYAKDISYAIPVENGNYKVNLNFAEIYFNQNNQRVFDVKAENQIVLDDFDIHQGTGGKNIAVEKTFDVNVQDGVLNLDLNASVNNAKLSGIEILSA